MTTICSINIQVFSMKRNFNKFNFSRMNKTFEYLYLKVCMNIRLKPLLIMQNSCVNSLKRVQNLLETPSFNIMLKIIEWLQTKPCWDSKQRFQYCTCLCIDRNVESVDLSPIEAAFLFIRRFHASYLEIANKR